MQRVGSGKSGGNQQLNLCLTELRPMLIRDHLHGAIQKAKLAHAMSPRRTEMVAAPAGISVEQNAKLRVIRFAQALNVNARALIFWDDRIVLQGLVEKASVIAWAA